MYGLSYPIAGSIIARHGERVVHLVHRQGREGVAPGGTVDGDLRDALVRFVDDLAVLLSRLPLDVAHVIPSAATRKRKGLREVLRVRNNGSEFARHKHAPHDIRIVRSV